MPSYESLDDGLGIPLQPTTVPASAASLAAGQLAYDIYTVETPYRTMRGTLQLPAAGSPATAAQIVRVHAPYRIKIITWVVQTVCPIGVKPVLPHWDTGNPNEVLCYDDVQPQTPILTPGGNAFTWRVEGEYHYLLQLPSNSFGSGGTPFCNLPAELFGLDESNFSRDILRSQNTTQSQPLEFATTTS